MPPWSASNRRVRSDISRSRCHPSIDRGRALARAERSALNWRWIERNSRARCCCCCCCGGVGVGVSDGAGAPAPVAFGGARFSSEPPATPAAPRIVALGGVATHDGEASAAEEGAIDGGGAPATAMGVRGGPTGVRGAPGEGDTAADRTGPTGVVGTENCAPANDSELARAIAAAYGDAGTAGALGALAVEEVALGTGEAVSGAVRIGVFGAGDATGVAAAAAADFVGVAAAGVAAVAKGGALGARVAAGGYAAAAENTVGSVGVGARPTAGALDAAVTAVGPPKLKLAGMLRLLVAPNVGKVAGRVGTLAAPKATTAGCGAVPNDKAAVGGLWEVNGRALGGFEAIGGYADGAAFGATEVAAAVVNGSAVGAFVAMGG